MTSKEVAEADEIRDREPGVDHGCRDHGEAHPLDVRLMDQKQVVGQQERGQQPAEGEGKPCPPVERQRADEAGAAADGPHDRADARDEADVRRALEGSDGVHREVAQGSVEYHPRC